MSRQQLVRVFSFIFIIFAVVNLLTGFQGTMTHGASYPDDFTMRYRESRYVLERQDPFDVVLGKSAANDSIGELWDVAGYTPWGMALGILINFSFLPEAVARIVYLCAYLAFFAFFIVFIRKALLHLGEGDAQETMLFLCALMAFPAWGTALSWLNFGAIFGGAIVCCVLLLPKHEIMAGALLGIAAAKPQLALPFYLAILLQKRYKAFITACALPGTLWLFCAWMVGRSPLFLLQELSEVTGKLSGDLGGWARQFGVPLSSTGYQIGCAAGCIVAAILLWCCVLKQRGTNHLLFFSIPAVFSGLWTYGQEHDRVVLAIFLLYVYQLFAENRTENKSAKRQRMYMTIGMALFALVVNPEGIRSYGHGLVYGLMLLKYGALVGSLVLCVKDYE